MSGVIAPGTAQSLQGFQNAGQAFFPGAFAFEAGFYFAQVQGSGCAGQQLGCGADLQGQGGGPGLKGVCTNVACFGRFWVVFGDQIGL